MANSFLCRFVLLVEPFQSAAYYPVADHNTIKLELITMALPGQGRITEWSCVPFVCLSQSVCPVNAQSPECEVAKTAYLVEILSACV